MNLELDRIQSNAVNTLSILFVDSDLFAIVPEDAFHFVDEKVAGMTRIPTGIYEMKKTFSPKFGKPMWEILNVPGFTGIRVHSGDSADDTEGCIMPGWALDIQLQGKHHTGRSREACAKLYELLDKAAAAGEQIRIKVSDEILERPGIF